MIAAKVTCLCRQMRLSGFGLDLKQGEFGWVDEKEARVSRELRHYERQGALKVEYLEKVDEMSRYPKWPRGAKVLPQRPGTPPAPATRATLPETDFEGADLSEAVLEMQSVLVQELQRLRVSFERKVVPPPAAPAPAPAPVPPASPPKVTVTVARPPEEMEVLKSLLAEVKSLHIVMEGLKGAISALAAHQRNLPATMLGAVQAMAAKIIDPAERDTPLIISQPRDTDRVDGAEHPVFIPSNLVDKDKSVSVASRESATGGLENSAAQLRALKGKSAARRDEEPR